MPYIMEFYVSSASRTIGPAGREVLAAASSAILTQRNGKTRTYKRAHYSHLYPPPTHVGAAVLAIGLALEKARERAGQLDNNPRMEIIVYSDNADAFNGVFNMVNYLKGYLSLTEYELQNFKERDRTEWVANMDVAMSSQRVEIKYILLDENTSKQPAAEMAKQAADEHLMGVA